ncbi:MAG TPA: alpha/beta hydrolase [Candidatus Kryptonia bacterium]|nr:alpha/beta hydrolase [Candidatus Kryptonia bacterium]
MREPSFPGAAAPERSRSFESAGVRLHGLEWGDPAATPLVLCHGMWDHARSFAVLAPLLAERFRVIAVDARGHGDSSWAAAYTWPTDVHDIVCVLRALGRPAHLLGHSKGGGQATDAACMAPQLVRQLVNIDGFGPPALPADDDPVPHLRQFLDARRAIAQRTTWRPYASLEALVERRRHQNPRLSREWLHYFIFHGASEDHDGWRWKHDPHMGHGFGPWRPDWIGPGYAALQAPMLAIVGSENDTWGPLPEPLLTERLAHVKRLERRTVTGAGHFVHNEQPAETARIILDFLER